MAIVNRWETPRPNCTLCGEVAQPPYMRWDAHVNLTFCAECCARSADGFMKDLIVMKAQYQISKIASGGWHIVQHKIERPKTEKEWLDDLHRECDQKMNVTNLAAAKPKP